MILFGEQRIENRIIVTIIFIIFKTRHLLLLWSLSPRIKVMSREWPASPLLRWPSLYLFFFFWSRMISLSAFLSHLKFGWKSDSKENWDKKQNSILFIRLFWLCVSSTSSVRLSRGFVRNQFFFLEFKWFQLDGIFFLKI